MDQSLSTSRGLTILFADALSHLDLLPDVPEERKDTPVHSTDITFNDYMTIHRNELPAEAYPLWMSQISSQQRLDTGLQNALRKNPSKYVRREVRGGRTTCDIIELDGKIVIPKQLRKRIVKWYHTTLMHPGITRLAKTIRMHFTWPGLGDDVKDYCKRCKTC